MILVTGGTGFVGQALIRHLVYMGKPLRILLRPSPDSPNLPRGVAVEVAVCGLKDERGLRAALKGVDVVFHLAGSERAGSHADLTGVDVEGTEVISRVCAEEGVRRFFYLSHIGADRSSAYPVLKAKAIAEHNVIDSGVNYTIFRSAPIFGENDQFTVPLVLLMKRLPFIFLMPGEGDSLLQPIWVEDVVACLALALDNPETSNQLFTIGGGEYLSYREILQMLLEASRLRRKLIPISPAYLRGITLFMEQLFPKLTMPFYWLDYLAADRTCPLDTLPREFGLMPTRFNQKLDYLQEILSV